MGSIVCATRGGEASRRTQEQAIALAKERDTDLIFLCVVDPSFAESSDDRLQEALEDELRRLGRSLLCIAQSRAREKGVDADAVIRCGQLQEEIEVCLDKTDADTLILGAPSTQSSTHAFGADDIHKFADTLQGATDTEVLVVT